MVGPTSKTDSDARVVHGACGVRRGGVRNFRRGLTGESFLYVFEYLA